MRRRVLQYPDEWQTVGRKKINCKQQGQDFFEIYVVPWVGGEVWNEVDIFNKVVRCIPGNYVELIKRPQRNIEKVREGFIVRLVDASTARAVVESLNKQPHKGLEAFLSLEACIAKKR